MELTDAVKQHLAEHGYDPTLGARPLRRAIQRLIEDPLSERLLHKEFKAGEIVVVDVEEVAEEDADDSTHEGKKVVFSSVAGFEVPTMEMAAEIVE